ncbi:hypothetical protein NMY22_g9289 [Coprinellus aureogranulatus]|nr:hypothetical protein NMY22_g9289 [Coprinellus aureogranulatus]
MSKGTNNYRNAGRWYAQCCYDGIGQCYQSLKYYTPALSDQSLLEDVELATLLIMREETFPEPTKENTTQARASRITIVNSPLFAQICDKLEIPEDRRIKPYSIDDVPSSRRKNAEVLTPNTPRLGESSHTQASETPTRKPRPFPHIPPLSNTPSTSVPRRGGAQASSSKAVDHDVISISSDSESDSGGEVGLAGDSDSFIPRVVMVFAWIEKYQRFREVALETDEQQCLRLSEFGDLLQSRGVQNAHPLEAFSVAAQRWVPLDRSRRIGPVGAKGGVLLVRYRGLNKHDLPGLAMLESFASPLVVPVHTASRKGKERETYCARVTTWPKSGETHAPSGLSPLSVSCIDAAELARQATDKRWDSGQMIPAAQVAQVMPMAAALALLAHQATQPLHGYPGPAKSELVPSSSDNPAILTSNEPKKENNDHFDMQAFARAPEEAPGAYESKLGSFLNATSTKLINLPESKENEEWAIIIARSRGRLETWALRLEKAELFIGASPYRKGLTFFLGLVLGGTFSFVYLAYLS